MTVVFGGAGVGEGEKNQNVSPCLSPPSSGKMSMDNEANVG